MNIAAVRWSEISVGSYCLACLSSGAVYLAKTARDKGRCLQTGRCIPLPDDQVEVVILNFPPSHVYIHEAAHFVFGLGLGEDVYLSSGILFNPYSPDAAECGAWINRVAEAEIRLALVGVLAQVKMAPTSFEPGLLRVFQTSVILDPEIAHPPDVSQAAWRSLGGARQDFNNARSAARRIRLNDSEQAIVQLMRGEESHLKESMTNTNFCEKVHVVAEDIPRWLQGLGRLEWEQAIVQHNLIFYPKTQGLGVLQHHGFTPQAT
jgi:hypothetical protein